MMSKIIAAKMVCYLYILIVVKATSALGRNVSAQLSKAVKKSKDKEVQIEELSASSSTIAFSAEIELTIYVPQV